MNIEIIECVPNFSEGKNLDIIKSITDAMNIPNITILDIDSGYDTNRTVVTIVGEPNDVIESAFIGIKTASKLIDMNKHFGEHPRMGATDVCPFIPIKNSSMKNCIKYSKILAKKVSQELHIPIFLYENSALISDRINLANIREGEFENMKEKLQKKDWKPDFGPAKPHISAGVTAIGARNFLIAYNVNLNTKDKKIATDIALEIREQGRNKRNKSGKFIRDNNGIPIKKPGLLKNCKAVGWYIEEYGLAQVSINLTNYKTTSPNKAFEIIREEARKRGLRVTGSEIVGLLPLDAMLSAGKFYLREQKRSTGIPESEIIQIAIKSMGLDELSKFDPNEKIIEYKIKKEDSVLANMKINNFLDLLSSESVAPGGGSVAALSGALSASLASMVANLTFGKKKWSKLYNKMSKIAENAQILKDELILLIDKDTTHQ